MEMIQYSTTFAITCAIKGTSGSKLYKELGLESLKSQRNHTHDTFKHSFFPLDYC